MGRLRKLGRRLATLVAVLWLVYTAVWLGLNDERLGGLVSKMVSRSVRGAGGPTQQAFVIGRAHYPYWCSLKSIVVGGACECDGYDFGMWDAEGHLVIAADHGHASVYVGELAHGLARLVVGKFDLELHIADVRVDHAFASIHPTASGEVNIVQAMAGKKQNPPGSGGIRITVDHADLRDIDYAIGFPGWQGAVTHAHGEATLSFSSFRVENPDKERPAFTWSVRGLAAPRGFLRMGAFSFPLDELHADLGAPPDARDELRFTGHAVTRGVPVDVDGKLFGTFSKRPGADLTVEVAHGGRLVPMLKLGDLLGGDPRARIHVHGPFSHATIYGVLGGGEVRLAGLVLRDAASRLYLDGPTLTLAGAEAQVGGGRVRGALTLHFDSLQWGAVFKSEHIDPSKLEPLVPRSAGPTLAGRVDGSFQLWGSLNPLDHPERIHVRRIDAHLERRAHDALPHAIDVDGGLVLSPTEVRLADVGIKASGVTARAKGRIDPRRGTTQAELTVEAHGIGPLLARLGLGPVAQGGHVSARVSGKLLEPTVDGTVTALGVGLGDKRLDRVDARLHLEHGTLAATDIHGAGWGGTVQGAATLALWRGAFTHPLAQPTIEAHADADRIRLHTLTGNPNLTGELTGRISLDGPLADPRGSAELRLPEFRVYDDPYRDGEFAVAIGERQISLTRLSFARAAGGSVTGAGRIGFDQTLDLELTAQDFPIAALHSLRSLPLPLAGEMSGKVHFGGTIDRPAPSGTLSAVGFKLREIILGDGRLDIKPGGDAIYLAGDFFHRFHVEGTVTLKPSLAINVTARFVDIPLDDLIPGMKKLAEVKSVVSGELNLSYAAGAEARAELRLSKAVVRLTGQGEDDLDAEGNEEFHNDGPIVLTSDFSKLTFKQARLASPSGQFEVEGDVSSEASDLRVRGALKLQLLEYFASSLFQHTHGHARADLHITGNAARPHITGDLDLADSELTPRGADRPFRVRGHVKFEDKGVRLDHLDLELDKARTSANGYLAVDNWVPGDIQLQVDGALSPTLLEWIFPEQIAETAGRIGVHARVGGHWPRPNWNGRIDVEDLAFRAKRFGRDLRVRAGTISLDDDLLTLGCPTGASPAADGAPSCRSLVMRLDDSGTLQADGTLRFRALDLAAVDVTLAGENLDWGQAGIYSLTLSPRLRLTGDGTQLRLVGRAQIVSGTYSQQFDYKDLVLKPRSVESEPPFYQGIALLEQLGLDVTVASSGPLSIKNNLATMQVSVSGLRIRGTLVSPTVSGAIDIEEGGTFKIPLLRADFVTDAGKILFEANRDFPGDTPRVDINAWSDWSDRYEQLHHIVLRLTGTYREPNLDLSSTDGWDKNQVLSALLTGGAPDDLRKSLAVGAPGAQGGGATSATDGLVKTFSGELFGNIVENPIKSVFKLDLVRVELGYVKLCPYNSRYFKLCGTGEGQLTPTSHYDARAELKLSDNLSMVGSAEHIEQGIDTSENIVNRGRLQLRVKFPIY